MNSQVRTAIDCILHDRPGVGDAYLFPSPDEPNKPTRYERATVWLEKAEELAKVPKLEGGVWHPYRRLWATERKHLPVQDVAAAGGWSSVEVLQEIYQKADPRTMLKVVEGGQGLREAM